MMKSVMMLMAGLVLMTAFVAPVARSDYYPHGELIIPDHDYAFQIPYGTAAAEWAECYYIRVEAYDNLTINLKTVEPSSRVVGAHFYTISKALHYRADKEDGNWFSDTGHRYPYNAHYSTSNIANNPLSIITSSYDIVLIIITAGCGDVLGQVTFNLTRHSTDDSVVSVVDSKLKATSDIYASDLNDIYIKTNKDLHDVQDGTNQTLNSLNMSLEEMRQSRAANETSFTSRLNALSDQLQTLKSNDTRQTQEITDLKAAQSGSNNAVLVGAGAGIGAGAVAGVVSALAFARRKPV